MKENINISSIEQKKREPFIKGGYCITKIPPGNNEPSVVFYIRDGRAIKISPIPDEKQASSIAQSLIDDWQESKNSYKETITLPFISEVFFTQQETRKRQEKGIQIVDYPLIQIKVSDFIFETRAISSICSEDKSTKIWTRIGFPEGDTTRERISPEDLQQVIPLCHQINHASIQWFYNRIHELLNPKEFKIEPTGFLEISTFGVWDKRLEPYFQTLLDTRISVADLLKDSDADRIMTSYYKKFLNFEGSLSNFCDENSARWLSTRVTVENNFGYMQPYEVLFLRVQNNNTTRFIGITYDDSARRDLSHWSVKEILDWVGKTEE